MKQHAPRLKTREPDSIAREMLHAAAKIGDTASGVYLAAAE
jgi:hypothetical protein